MSTVIPQLQTVIPHIATSVAALLYVLLAATYVITAYFASHEEHHKKLWISYSCAAFLHCGLAACHVMQMG